ncbi:MAG TPA: cytochrome B, partial [Candidatus Marinimicrobia bacterium]|nr:cytochrome B [Candidatus Neomarinimicrobiota bacterium]
MKTIRKIYDWVLDWSESKYGPFALFCLAFAESSFFPIPPDVLLIALALGARKKSFQFAIICSLASIAG